MTQQSRVLNDLKRKTKRGVSALDYPTGFPIRSRISDLRQQGYTITSRKDSDTPLYRYYLA